MALKENQPLLYQAFPGSPVRTPKRSRHQRTETIDKGHGRMEKRSYYLSGEMDWYADREKWAGLAGLGMVCSKVEMNGKTSKDHRCFITTLTDVASFSRAARKHWGIENSLHWCLDMMFRKHYSRIHKDHSAGNMAVIRHIALNIPQNFPAKISLARKRSRCSYDDDFFAKVMRSVHA